MIPKINVLWQWTGPAFVVISYILSCTFSLQGAFSSVILWFHNSMSVPDIFPFPDSYAVLPFLSLGSCSSMLCVLFWHICLFFHSIAVQEAPCQMLIMKWGGTPDHPLPPPNSPEATGQQGRETLVNILPPECVATVWDECPEHRWAWRTWPRCVLGVPLSNWHAQWNSHRAWDGWSKVGEWVSLVIGVPPPLLKPPSPPTWAHVIITLHPSLGQFLTLGISPEPSFLTCQNIPVCCLTSLCLAQP